MCDDPSLVGSECECVGGHRTARTAKRGGGPDFLWVGTRENERGSCEWRYVRLPSVRCPPIKPFSPSPSFLYFSWKSGTGKWEWDSVD